MHPLAVVDELLLLHNFPNGLLDVRVLHNAVGPRFRMCSTGSCSRCPDAVLYNAKIWFGMTFEGANAATSLNQLIEAICSIWIEILTGDKGHMGLLLQGRLQFIIVIFPIFNCKMMNSKNIC